MWLATGPTWWLSRWPFLDRPDRRALPVKPATPAPRARPVQQARLAKPEAAAQWWLSRPPRQRQPIEIRIHANKENGMSLGMIVLIVLLLMLVGAIPTWGHSKSWGYGPSGGIGLILVIVIVLLLMGRL